MYLYGASGHAKVIIDMLERSGIEVHGLFDDNPAIAALLGYPCLGPYAAYPHPIQAELIISIGDNHIRKTIADKLPLQYGSCAHPSAILSRHSQLGAGTVAMARAVVNPGTSIGRHVILNTACSVDHDCTLADFVHISPNATLCGGVSIGEGAHIGAAAVVAPNLSIGAWAVIGAGAVVVKDVPERAVVVGNPGRVVRFG